ncbi:MAG: DUF5602 domain-containing protein [Pseudanabaena sp. RU_4_16]|nr:DUF5602 domain-containing protein [Pseudanabaena sp. RU_4_16]
MPVQSGNSFFPEPVVTRNHETIFVTEGELSFQIDGQTKSAPANTFVYIAPGQSYAMANFGDRQAKAVASTIVDSYIPKIGQYLEGNQRFIGTVSRGNEFIQGNVTSTKPQAIGDGWIYTWGAFDAEGSPSSIGVTFTQEVLSNNQGLDAFQVTDPNNRFPRLVPHLALTDQFDAARVYDIPFPQEVVAKTPFNHMGFYANSQGHAPLMVYDTPHFDVHFFISSLEDRDLITGLPQDNANLFNFPPNGFLNRDYIAPTVPGTDIPATGDALQGVHWVDRNTPEFNGGEFSQTFIFGTYAGQVNFWEPMITKEFMEELSASGERTTKKTFAIKQPTRFLEDGYYPLEYSITYNRDFGEYTISLDNLTFRSDNPLGGLPPIPGGMPPMMM